MGETASETSEQASFNTANYQNISALQMRLDTHSVLERIEKYLRGKIEVYGYNKEGLPSMEFKEIGKPKANDLGVQSILTMVAGVINSQTVQGNFSRPEFLDMMMLYHIDVTKAIVLQRKNWEIDIKDMDMIINFVVYLVTAFMSRTVENKERDSYRDSMRVYESRVEQQGGGGFKWPFQKK